jgi:regulatory protein
LRSKGVSKEIIDEVVAPMIDNTDMAERLEEIMRRKMRTLKYSSAYDAKTKLIRFAASRGYELDEAIECASKIVGE